MSDSITAAWLDRAQRDKLALTIIAGAVLGAGVALTSVGAGALGVVALLALYPLRLTPDRLVATDIAHALPITILAAAGHAALGHTDLRVLACLLVGSIPGVLLASRASIRLPAPATRTLIAVMLGAVSARNVRLRVDSGVVQSALALQAEEAQLLDAVHLGERARRMPVADG